MRCLLKSRSRFGIVHHLDLKGGCTWPGLSANMLQSDYKIVVTSMKYKL